MKEFLDILLPRKKQWLGLDISDSHARLVELAFGNGRWILKNALFKPLPSGCLVDGRIERIDAVAQVVQQLLASAKPASKQLIMAIPEEATFTKISRYTVGASEDELLADIRAEASEYIPFDLSKVGLDFFPFPPKDNDATQQEVLTVAARNEFIQDRQNLADRLGLKLAVVEVDRYATWLSLNYYLKQRDLLDRGASYLTLYIGSKLLRIKFYKGDTEIFSRTVAFGDVALIGRIAEKYKLKGQQVRRKLLDDSFGAEAAAVKELQQQFLIELEKEIDNILVVAKNTFGHISLTAGLLMCNAYLPKDFDARLAKVCDVRLTRVNPFINMEVAANIDIEEVRSIASAYACACGLAMRGKE